MVGCPIDSRRLHTARRERRCLSLGCRSPHSGCRDFRGYAPRPGRPGTQSPLCPVLGRHLRNGGTYSLQGLAVGGVHVSISFSPAITSTTDSNRRSVGFASRVDPSPDPIRPPTTAATIQYGSIGG